MSGSRRFFKDEKFSGKYFITESKLGKSAKRIETVSIGSTIIAYLI